MALLIARPERCTKMTNESISISLQRFLTHLTSEPGVYRMIDAEGTVLYVGKASNLYKRVNSYFSKHLSGIKTRSLVSQINSIEVSVTRSETEALLLESTLIKSLRPKYNILMRDDKTYPFIHISSTHGFPRIELMRAKKKPKHGDFFGPYPSTTAVRETINIIQKVFKIRNCSDNYFNARSRPCLQFQIKRCTAPCVGLISAADYQRALQDAKLFLQGKSHQILEQLAKRMQDAVDHLAFEEAATFRDQIKNLRLIQEQQGMVQVQGDADVIVIEAIPGFACIQCVTIRDGEILNSQSFFPSVPILEVDAESSLWQHVFATFIAYYYVEMPDRIPALIITDQAIDDYETTKALLSELRSKACQIQYRPRGAKAKWLDFALNNLRKSIDEHRASTHTMSSRYQALCHLIGVSYPITRMECFDISHTQGNATIASCVVFDEQGPSRRDYRRFNITGITPGDDYAAMQQAITRRLKRLMEEGNLPDVLIVDGGKGQLNIAKNIVTDLGIEGLTLIGIAKGPDRKAGWERLIIGNGSQEITLAADSQALHLLQYIRDEAHRFAITAHRKKRQKTSFESSLDSVEGIGPKRRHALLQRFGGIRELAKAPVEEISKVSGISRELAERIYQHFRQ